MSFFGPLEGATRCAVDARRCRMTEQAAQNARCCYLQVRVQVQVRCSLPSTISRVQGPAEPCSHLEQERKKPSKSPSTNGSKIQRLDSKFYWGRRDECVIDLICGPFVMRDGERRSQVEECRRGLQGFVGSSIGAGFVT